MRQVVSVVVRRAGYLLLGTALLAFVAWDGPMARLLRWLHLSQVELRPELVVRVVCAALLVGLGFIVRYRFHNRWNATHLTDLAPGKPIPEIRRRASRKNREILLSMQSVSAKYSPAAIAVFGDMLTEPEAHQLRITDEVEPFGECLRISVSTTYGLTPDQSEVLGDGGSQVVLVPLIKASKGTMLDNVDTSDGADNSVPFLPQRDTRGLIALVLYGLFERAFVFDGPALSPRQKDALWRLLRLACQPGRVPVGKVNRQFKRALRDAGTPRSEDSVRKLRRICTYFAWNYVVVAEAALPEGPSFILRYRKTVPDYGRADSPWSSWRVRVGLRPHRYIVPINLAFTAQSYHFRMNGGLNWYVRWHYLMDIPTGKPVTQSEVRAANGPVYLRVRHRQALPYAHLYTRGTSVRDEQMNLATVVEFAEIPPGALGVTFALSALSALLMVFLALFVPTYESNKVSGDVLALLLTVPPVAATFVGYSIDIVQRSTFATLLGLMLVGIMSFAAAAIYVQKTPPSLLLDEPVLFGFLHLPSINLLGLLVGLVAVCNAVHLYWRLRLETRHYLDRLREKNSVRMMFVNGRKSDE